MKKHNQQDRTVASYEATQACCNKGLAKVDPQYICRGASQVCMGYKGGNNWGTCYDGLVAAKVFRDSNYRGPNRDLEVIIHNLMIKY